MFAILRRNAMILIEELTRGYSWVTLVPSSKVGFCMGLLTFLEPSVGTAGLIGAICAWYAGHVAGADAGERPVCVFNGLLTGLFISHVWVLNVAVIALTVLGGMFAGWLTVVLARLAWSLIRLPILSLPFCFVAILTSGAGGSLSTLTFNSYLAPPELFGVGIDGFLAALGNLYFIPNPFVGLFVLGVLVVFSRYYVLLAVTGYLAAQFWLNLLGAAPEHLATTAWDSNAILAALFVGGLFATPSLTTLALALLAAVVAGWLALGLGRILDVAHLLPFSIPFVLASWLVLYAAVRNSKMASSFNSHEPDFPEKSYERAKVSRARVGTPASVALAPPFSGWWTVSQGFSGQHTHRGHWRHALDFIVMVEGKSFAKQGRYLTDFYCYNLPVYSPAYGQVWRIVNDIPDNAPGTVNVAAAFGNCVLIRLYDGTFALVAHFKPWSITVLPGAWVKAGDYLGLCGNSGRSPQPHIHMHLQTGPEVAAPTLPFHLASVLISDKPGTSRYELAVVPDESAVLASAGAGDVRAFYLMAGRGLRYTVAHNESVVREWTLHCEIDDRGRLNLVSSTGGRCIAESSWAVFSCYERQGTVDPYLDIWLLACGFTPASFYVEHWQDRATPARLLPQPVAKWLAVVCWPWAAFAESNYQRQWDEEAQGWRQLGSHRQNVGGLRVSTVALIVPQVGCTNISADVGRSRYQMQATSSFQRDDIGVPGWEASIEISHKKPY